jgi:hypothetical protein
MDRRFRTIEVVLLVMLGLTYLVAKIHFFTRYAAHDYTAYLAEHWPFWAAMAIIVAAMGILECVGRALHSKRKSEGQE